MTGYDVHTRAEMSRGVTLPVWLGARLAALAIAGILLVLLLVLDQPTPRVSPPSVTFERDVSLTLEAPRPLAPKVPIAPSITDPDAEEARISRASASQSGPTSTKPATPNFSSQAQPSYTQSRATDARPKVDLPAAKKGAQAPQQVPRIASAPSGQGQIGGATGQGQSATPVLRGASLRIARARECARLDVRDRPADCPPNEELMRLLAAERGPKYRPENAEGFSRNEQAWRGIPEPCLEQGTQAGFRNGKLCVRFGNTPSRVRSPQEICEARGLGGCAPTPNQAAVNAAVQQARAQEAATPRER
jgi:hypothetical protein